MKSVVLASSISASQAVSFTWSAPENHVPWCGVPSAQVCVCVCVCVCVWWVGAQCFWHQWAAGLCVCGAVTPSTCMLFGSTSKLPAVAMLTWTWPPPLREINTFPSLWLCSLGSKLEM